MRIHSIISLTLGILLAGKVRADVTIADFESAEPVQASANVTADRVETDSPQGKAYLRLMMKPDERTAGMVTIPQDGPLPFDGADHLSAQVRVRGTGESRILRWVAYDESGKPIFQRRFELKPGETWVRLDEPLRQWRWHDATPGSWKDVRRLGLRVETPTAEVDVDDIRLVGSATPAQRTEWLLRLAFADRPIRQLEDSGVLVATDALEGLSDQSLRTLVNDMLHVRTWGKRIFGEAVRPVEGEGPVMLLIFASDGQRRVFFARLGEQWRATLSFPQSAGFTVQDICSSTYDPRQGVKRPVYLHESVHGILAHDLRLPSGYAMTSPLQEAMANYLQLCVYPQSLSPRTFTINFDKPIDPTGRGYFKPLEKLFESRAQAETYAQLASFAGYLVEREPALLRSLARGLADGRTATEVLAANQTDWPTLERNWFEWGRMRYAKNPPGNPGFFELPKEFE